MTATPVMKANARTAAGTPSGGRRLLPKLLVMAQVVLSLVLLAGAGLFLRTLRNLDHQNFGFHRDHLLLVHFAATRRRPDPACGRASIAGNRSRGRSGQRER